MGFCKYCNQRIAWGEVNGKWTKYEPDRATLHQCPQQSFPATAATTTNPPSYQQHQQQQPTNDNNNRSTRIDELAMMKIDALRAIADAIKDLASAVRMRDLDSEYDIKLSGGEDLHKDKKEKEEEENRPENDG